MFNLGVGEMLLLAAIALVAIGPKQLPQVARVIGKLIRDLKRTMAEVTTTVATEMNKEDKPHHTPKPELRDVNPIDTNDSKNKSGES